MKKHTLTVQSRVVLGRKVKQLRSVGQIPATVYGKNVKSFSVTLEGDQFEKIHREAGETGLIELTVGKDVRPVLIHTVQVHPVTRQILHVEFRQVDLKEKVKANVPLQFVGVAKAVVDKKGVLLTIVDSIEVEALPTDLPENITLDVYGLAQVNDEFKVKDLKAPSGVTILPDPELTIVKVGSLVSREASEQAAAEEAQKAAVVEGAAAEAVPVAEGQTPVEKPAQAGKKEEAKEEKKDQ